MESHLKVVVVMVSVVLMVLEMSLMAQAVVPVSLLKQIDRVNKNGPYLGIVVPNSFELNPLLQSPNLVVDHTLPSLDISGLANPHIYSFIQQTTVDIFCFRFYRTTVSIWKCKRQEGYSCADRTKHGMLM